MSGVRQGRGRPVTLIAPGGPGHGAPIELMQAWTRPLALRGTRLFFQYERSGHFDSARAIRRRADRDAFEVSSLASAGGATRAVGFSRGAQAVVGSLVGDPSRFERVVLIWPPSGDWAPGAHVSWVGHAKQVPERVVDPGAQVLVVAQQLNRDHSVKMAEQWAWALRARLEVFPADGALWSEHRERFKALVGGFLNEGL